MMVCALRILLYCHKDIHNIYDYVYVVIYDGVCVKDIVVLP